MVFISFQDKKAPESYQFQGPIKQWSFEPEKTKRSLDWISAGPEWVVMATDDREKVTIKCGEKVEVLAAETTTVISRKSSEISAADIVIRRSMNGEAAVGDGETQNTATVSISTWQIGNFGRHPGVQELQRELKELSENGELSNLPFWTYVTSITGGCGCIGTVLIAKPRRKSDRSNGLPGERQKKASSSAPYRIVPPQKTSRSRPHLKNDDVASNSNTASIKNQIRNFSSLFRERDD